MRFDPDQHHRQSHRLRGRDYSQPGHYFVTICSHDMTCLFGDIIDGQMQPNYLGQIVQAHWLQLPSHFTNLKLEAWQLMPNHLHGILILTPPEPATVRANKARLDVRAESGTDVAPYSPLHRSQNVPSESESTVAPYSPLHPRPNVPSESESSVAPYSPLHRGQNVPSESESSVAPYSPLRPRPNESVDDNTPFAPLRQPDSGPHGTTPGSIGAIIQSFKRTTTVTIRRITRDPEIRVWQRDYYDHIVGDHADLIRIRKYIVQNPARWTEDRVNPANQRP
jgi:putative transposase